MAPSVSMRSIGLVCGLLAVRGALAQTPGLVPLDDLGSGTYMGFSGGLYPGSVNEPPLSHLDRALDAAARVQPLDALGAPALNGAILLLAVGMSNTNQEFAVFERDEDAAADRNARVVLVDGGVGGPDAVTLADPSAPYWSVLASRIAAAGLTAAQVQVVWLKEAVQGGVAPFPTDALDLRDSLEAIVQILHDRFPNLRLCYLSSRIYGGYSGAGEPKAYDTGFAVKWLIEDQIDGDPALNDGRLSGPIEAPLLLWGPYLWANGPVPRSDGLTWLAGDVESDGTHPAASGEQKVADLLASFFDDEITAAAWWPRGGAAGLLAVETDKDAHVDAADAATSFGGAPRLAVQGGALPIQAYLGFALPGLGAAAERVKLSLRVPTDSQGGGHVSAVASTAWTEAGITWSSAPAIGALLVSVPQSSRDGTIAADVTGLVNGDADGLVSFAITSPAAAASAYHSREGGQAPRLVVTISCAGGGPPGLPDADGDGAKDPCDCAPSDAALLARPGEVESLRWADPAQLTWDPGAAEWGGATVYDVTSGELDDVRVLWPAAGDACIATDLILEQAQDTTPPPPAGTGRFFLVRARNSCGAGRWTTTSGGRDRVVAGCP